MKNSRWVKFFLPLTILVLMLGVMACSSSNDDDSSSSGSTTFTADTSSAPANSVYLELESQNNDTIVLAVKVKDLSNVYGIWFNLNFDGSIFNYAGSAEGSFLNQGASTFFFATGKSSTVVVGLSRQGDASGVSGSGTLCKLTFDGIKEGTSRFDFALNSAAAPDGNPIGGISWFGGTATVVM